MFDGVARLEKSCPKSEKRIFPEMIPDPGRIVIRVPVLAELSSLSFF
jgi:hypothetical protein